MFRRLSVILRGRFCHILDKTTRYWLKVKCLKQCHIEALTESGLR
jgi:hypothetical protein